MKNGIVHRLGRAPEAAAWNVVGCGCHLVMEIKGTKGVVIPRLGENAKHLSLEAVNTEPPDASYFRNIKLIRYIRPDWGYDSTFGVPITNCKRLNSDNVIFAKSVMCLTNSAKQKKRDKHADIY